MTNDCDCPNPPGGSVSCKHGQIAYCLVENGVTKAGCYDIKSSAIQVVKDKDEVIREFIMFLAESILRTYGSELLDRIPNLQRQSEYNSDDGNFQLKFSLPSSLT